MRSCVGSRPCRAIGLCQTAVAATSALKSGRPMTSRATQLAFDFFGTASKAGECGSEAADPLAERLIAGGIVANEYQLGVHRSLQNPDPLPAPSRLYQFPLEFIGRDRLEEGAPSRLLLNHPDLGNLPFV